MANTGRWYAERVAHRPYEPGTPLVLLWRAVPAQAQRAAGQLVVPVADERVGGRAGAPRGAPGSRQIEREPFVAKGSAQADSTPQGNPIHVSIGDTKITLLGQVPLTDRLADATSLSRA